MMDAVREDPGKFTLKRDFFEPVIVIRRRLSRPADVHRRINVGTRPLHYFAEFPPVPDVGKVHFLYRRTRYDQTVELNFFGADVVESLVERAKILLARIAAAITCSRQKSNFHLKRRVSEHAKDLRFGSGFVRHKIKNRDAKRSDVLTQRALVSHYEYVFVFEEFSGR